MNQFPLEIIVHIFQYLSKKEQIKVSEVNKKFREALFSPSLWTDIMEVPASQLESFSEFLKQTPWLKYLNLQVSNSLNKLSSFVNLTSVFKPLINLECLVLQLNNCPIKKVSFPCTLKHISVTWKNEVRYEILGFTPPIGIRANLYTISTPKCAILIGSAILIGIADSCPQLEHIQIKSLDFPIIDHGELRYLLEKINRSLKTLILSETVLYANFSYLDCPPNLTNLCLAARIPCNKNRSERPHLENLQILSFCNVTDFGGKYFSNIFLNCSLKNLKFLFLGVVFPLKFTEFFERFTKIPNLLVLYFKKRHVEPNDIDYMMRFVRGCCPSLKVLGLDDEYGYSETTLVELENLKKEIPVKIYLKFTGETEVPYNIFPTFPNANFERTETFNHSMLFDIRCENSPNCRSHLRKMILGLRKDAS